MEIFSASRHLPTLWNVKETLLKETNSKNSNYFFCKNFKWLQNRKPKFYFGFIKRVLTFSVVKLFISFWKTKNVKNFSKSSLICLFRHFSVSLKFYQNLIITAKYNNLSTFCFLLTMLNQHPDKLFKRKCFLENIIIIMQHIRK